MLYEYMLNLRSHFRNYISEETVVCWGEDEYDALNKYITKFLNKEEKQKDSIKEIYINDKYLTDFSICRLRPTGRSKYSYEKSKPFFDADLRPYIKGLITRYMVRFIVSDTIDELEHYKLEFDDYLENYGQEITDEIKDGMLLQYKIQENNIIRGKVKPLEVNLDINYQKNKSSEESLEYYTEQVTKILRMFGFRVNKNGQNYVVLIPKHYHKVLKETINNPIEFSPLQLILFWERNEFITYSLDRERYGIEEHKKPVLEYLGFSSDNQDFGNICRSLRTSDIIPLYLENEYKDLELWVLRKDFDRAVEILRNIKAKLYMVIGDFAGPLYGSDLSFNEKHCIICGDLIEGNDILCEVCSNNID